VEDALGPDGPFISFHPISPQHVVTWLDRNWRRACKAVQDRKSRHRDTCTSVRAYSILAVSHPAGRSRGPSPRHWWSL